MQQWSILLWRSARRNPKAQTRTSPLKFTRTPGSGLVRSTARPDSYSISISTPTGQTPFGIYDAELTAHRSKGNGSSKPNRPVASKKPRPDFPLFAHQGGRWCKKVKWTKNDGQEYWRFVYFTHVEDDPQGEEAERWYEHDLPYLSRSKEPPEYTPEKEHEDGLTLIDLCEEFICEKESLMVQGELSPRSFADYKKSCQRLLDYFGKGREVESLTFKDFRDLRAYLADGWSAVTLGNELTRLRVVFNFGYDNSLISEPLNYGTAFKRPKAKHIRKHRNEQKRKNGLRMFQAEELGLILDALAVKQVVTKLIDEDTGKPVKLELRPRYDLRAMVLLGINCGLGNPDVSDLREEHLDLEPGWLDYPRPKTECDRESALWPETVEAIRIAMEVRPKPKASEDRGLVFLTSTGRKWVRLNANHSPNDELSKAFARLLKRLGLKRPRLNFYAIRHSFETIGGGCRDQVAVDYCMGDVDSSMSGTYREEIDHSRLFEVAAHVRSWLWPDAGSCPES